MTGGVKIKVNHYRGLHAKNHGPSSKNEAVHPPPSTVMLKRTIPFVDVGKEEKRKRKEKREEKRKREK